MRETTHFYQDRDFADEHVERCAFDPFTVSGALGMFHCPLCGEMVFAGIPHPLLEDYFFTGMVMIFGEEE